MSNNIKAFPGKRSLETSFGNMVVHDGGMDLRDYFAAKALPQIINQWARIDYNEMNQADADNIAEQSYAIADAMMKERAQPIQELVSEAKEHFKSKNTESEA